MGARERFIRDTLEDQGRIMLRDQGNAIFLGYNQRSGRLMNSRRISVTGEENPVLTFEHPIYERFLDLKFRRQKRDRCIHNRFVYGTYSAIARRLTLGYEEEAAAMLREIVR